MALSLTPSRSNSLSTQQPPSPSPSSRNNPISLRICKSISTSFDDPSSRQALEIASSFYTSSDDNDHQDGPRRTLKGQTAAMARKHLKRDVESKLAGGSRRFLEAFGEVDKKLDVLREHMKEMQVRCDQVQAELDQANHGTKHLLEKADGLRSQRSSAQLRATLVQLFLTRFTLSENELAALTSREVPVGRALFAALDRVEAIRRDCQTLLGGEEGSMTAGLDIMAATSTQMEAGYAKLHRWCQFEFRQFTREGQLEVSDIMREGVKRLRDRASLLKDAIQVLTSTRHSSILTSFLDALTRGGPNGLPRPIELHAHDPTRYVGDMLAWVHQTTASEHEFLESLFGVKEKRRMVGAAREVEQGEEEKMVADSMDRDLEGLSRPLKMRIQQTIKSQEGIIMAYKIANLLHFYLVTMRKTIGHHAVLCTTLQEIYDESYQAFIETLEAQGRSLLRFLHPPDATLSPPLALRDATQILREVITVYDTSLVDEQDRSEDKAFAQILDKAVGPAVEMCERMGGMIEKPSVSSGLGSGLGSGSGTGEWERDIFMINCLGYLVHALEVYPFTSERVNLLEQQISKHVQSMTFEHHGRLLELCGLSPIMKTIRTRPSDTPLSRLPQTSPKNLTTSLTTFTNFLTSPQVLASPTLTLLSSPNLAERIHRTALRKISAAYGEVCERVLDKAEGYEFGETLLRRGREEVEVALGVYGDAGEEEVEGEESR